MGSSTHTSSFAHWAQRILGFLIGLFGAAAILGVFFKIVKWDHYEIFMIVGFIGEAAAFIAMGVLALFHVSEEAKAPKQEASSEKSSAKAAAEAKARREAIAEKAAADITSSMQKMIEEQVGKDFRRIMLALARTTKQFGDEMQALGGELQETRQTVHAMRAELDKVVSQGLEQDAEALGQGMQQLGNGMASAGSVVKQMQADLEDMAQRFESFNRSERSPAELSRTNGQSETVR